MDPISLSVIAVGILAKALEKAQDKAAGLMVEEGGHAAEGLVQWVRVRFGGRRELERLEESPDSPRAAQALEAIIDAEIVGDPSARAELAAVLADVEKDAPTVYQEAVGTGNILVSGSQGVSITQNIGANHARQPAVAWRLENVKGDRYVLRNSGSATAYGVAVVAEGLVRPPGDPLDGSIDMDPDDAETFIAMRTLQSKAEHVTVSWADQPGGERRSKRLLLPPG